MGDQAGEVNFFGIKINVKNPKLAAVLNSSVTDDVVVVAQRARGEEAGRPAGEASPTRALQLRSAGRIGAEPVDRAARVSTLPPEWIDLRLTEPAEWDGADTDGDPLAVLSPAADEPAKDSRAS